MTDAAGSPFGAVHETHEVSALRVRLHGRLLEVVRQLPDALAGPVREEICSHGRSARHETGDFFARFPAPVWSFLSWVPSARTADAERAQALALFLHLWDDHLADGRLASTAAARRLRAAAWAEWECSARAACRAWGVPDRPVAEAGACYLRSVSPAGGAGQPGAGAHLRSAARQAAMWVLLPRALEQARATGPGLARAVRGFCLAWRIVDDLWDVAEDAAAGVRTTVWWELPRDARALWDERPGPWRMPELRETIGRLGIDGRLRARAVRLLTRAVRDAERAGLPGLAVELRTATVGVTGSAPLW
ncbi:hypothetical protein GCM10010218_37950 [Streptomyces mashuensis]|uniref:Uncharacterized protein n=1 Tax=Streptomyces mashuensis TaxID=33904 RepID=A0A919B4A9_9ACTN|nr:hypothetical protein [Streptomyces mashuensis]GHF52902.1 hypothetical protein GCM10010218_37950 [Streptomyces mashuensis]